MKKNWFLDVTSSMFSFKINGNFSEWWFFLNAYMWYYTTTIQLNYFTIQHKNWLTDNKCAKMCLSFYWRARFISDCVLSSLFFFVVAFYLKATIIAAIQNLLVEEVNVKGRLSFSRYTVSRSRALVFFEQWEWL